MSRLSRFLDFFRSEPLAAPDRPGSLPVLESADPRVYYREAQLQFWGTQLSVSADDPRLASLPAAGTHPILQITSRLPGTGAVHETQLLVFHAMRQYSPTLDQALTNRRTLEGTPEVTSEDEGLQKMLNDFLEMVPVGHLAGRASLKGLDTYANMMADNADEYGLSAGEIQLDDAGRTVRRLVVPNVRTLFLRDENQDDTYELWQRQRGHLRRIDDAPFVQVLSLSLATEGPWPAPLAWSAVQTTEAVLRMTESVANAWWRFGDPSLLNVMEFDKEVTPAMSVLSEGDGTVEVPSALLLLRNTLEGIMKARRQGKVGDAYVSVQGGSVRSEVLGKADAAMMRYFREQATTFDGQIVGLSKTPIWMYPHLEQTGDGLGSGRSDNQSLIASVDADKRNRAKERIIREVLDTHLIVTGDARHLGKYDIEFTCASILDDKVEAETDKIRAEAAAQHIENAAQLFEEDGSRRFTGEAEGYLEEREVLMKTT